MPKKIKPNDDIAAFVHGIQQKVVSDVMSKGIRRHDGLLLPSEVVDKLMERYAFTFFSELDEPTKHECRQIAVSIQNIFIGEGDDDENMTEEPAGDGSRVLGYEQVRKQISDAGDRRDWDECDRLEGTKK